MPGRERRPGDIVRLVVGLAVLGAAWLLVEPTVVRGPEADLFTAVNGWPGWLHLPAWVAMWFGSFLAIPTLALLALFTRRRDAAAAVAVGGVIAWLGAQWVKDIVGRPRPAALLDDVTIRGGEVAGWGFVSGHATVAVALATLLAPHLATRARRNLYVLAGIVGVARLFIGAHLPLDVVGGAGLGLAIGSLWHILRGVPADDEPAPNARP